MLSRQSTGLLAFWRDYDRKTYVKAGKMFLPSGRRLQDDSAFVRLFTGINYETPDDVVEIGYANGP